MSANPLAVIVLAIMWARFYPSTSYLLILVLAAASVVRAVVRSQRAVAALKQQAGHDLGALEQFRQFPDDLKVDGCGD
jgi:hypothetical protein